MDGDTTDTATITSVDTTRSAVFYLGESNNNLNSQTQAKIVLTNATTVTGSCNTSSVTHRVKFMVVEFTASSVKTRNAGTIVIASGASSGTATISAVDTTKTILASGGCTSNIAGAGAGSNLTLTNSTTVTATRVSTAADTSDVPWTAIEFN